MRSRSSTAGIRALSGSPSMTFTESMEKLAEDNCSLHAASERPVA
jgi:hypothetical protein